MLEVFGQIGGFGRWAFLGIRNPWEAQNEIRREPKRSGNG